MSAESVDVWCNEEKHPYPWHFAVTYMGVRYVFAGIPNMCATRKQAYQRGHAKLRSMKKDRLKEETDKIIIDEFKKLIRPLGYWLNIYSAARNVGNTTILKPPVSKNHDALSTRIF